MNPALLTIIQVALQIFQRHQEANPGAPPLTAEQIEEMIRAEVAAGEHRDLQWFLAQGFPPPQ